MVVAASAMGMAVGDFLGRGRANVLNSDLEFDGFARQWMIAIYIHIKLSYFQNNSLPWPMLGIYNYFHT